MIASLAGVVFFPGTWMWIATAFMGYLTVYVLLIFAFAMIGEGKRRSCEARDWTIGEDEVGPFGFSPAEVRHAVIVPNYKEPLDVLERTIEGLAAQHRASERIVLVLGMEEREPGAQAKGEALAGRYRDRFRHVIVSVHPGSLPGELPCKASNQTFAAIKTRRVMADELDIPLERITVSACDADSVFHPKYFSAIAEMFAHDERRHSRFWQAPMLYYNNIWSVPAPIRYTAWFIHAGLLAELAMPFYDPLPISTYTLSMKLAEETQWWDPAVISEDWHVYLGAMFARDGDVSVVSVFLPTRSDATDGPTPWKALVNRYLQVLRHSWGAEDVGFILKSMIGERRVPRPLTAFRLVQVLHDHVMRVAAWCMIMTGYALNFSVATAAGAYGLAIAANAPERLRFAMSAFFVVGSISIVSAVVVEMLRNPPPKSWSPLRIGVEVLLMWFLSPVIGLSLGVAPAVHAQTKLMFGLPLAWRVTPKHLAERLSDAA